jgi:hypothetical protein
VNFLGAGGVGWAAMSRVGPAIAALLLGSCALPTIWEHCRGATMCAALPKEAREVIIQA